jgi:hypothetical protein
MISEIVTSITGVKLDVVQVAIAFFMVVLVLHFYSKLSAAVNEKQRIKRGVKRRVEQHRINAEYKAYMKDHNKDGSKKNQSMTRPAGQNKPRMPKTLGQNVIGKTEKSQNPYRGDRRKPTGSVIKVRAVDQSKRQKGSFDHYDKPTKDSQAKINTILLQNHQKIGQFKNMKRVNWAMDRAAQRKS